MIKVLSTHTHTHTHTHTIFPTKLHKCVTLLIVRSMLERDKFCKVLKLIIKKFYSASGTCLSTNGISNESLQYRM